MHDETTTDAGAHREIEKDLVVPARPVNRFGERGGAHVRFDYRRRDSRKALTYRPSLPLDRVSARDIALEIDQLGHAEADPSDLHPRRFSSVYQFDRKRLDIAQHRFPAAPGAGRQIYGEEQLTPPRHNARGDFCPADVNAKSADVICHWSFVPGHLSFVIGHLSLVIRHSSGEGLRTNDQ